MAFYKGGMTRCHKVRSTISKDVFDADLTVQYLIYSDELDSEDIVLIDCRPYFLSSR